MRVWKEDDWPCLEQAPKVWGDNDDNGPPGGRGMLWTLQLMPCEDIPKPFAYQLLSAFCCSGQWLLQRPGQGIECREGEELCAATHGRLELPLLKGAAVLGSLVM